MLTLPQIVLMAVAGLALVVLAVEAIRDAGRRRALRRDTDRAPPAGANGVAEDEAVAPPGWLSRLVPVGLPIPAGLLVLVVIAVALWVSLRVSDLFAGAWLPALLAFLLIVYLCYEFLAEIGRIRSIRFEEKLVNAIDLLISTLRAGQNPTQALAATANAIDRPVRQEFEEVVSRLNVGMPIRRALSRMMGRYGSEGVRMFGSTLAAKWGAGGDLAPVLLKVNRIMRERLRHRLRLRSQMSGAHLAALLVAFAPYLILVAFYLFQPDWVLTLLAHPAGPTSLLIAVGLQVVGFLWLSRLIRIEL